MMNKWKKQRIVPTWMSLKYKDVPLAKSHLKGDVTIVQPEGLDEIM